MNLQRSSSVICLGLLLADFTLASGCKGSKSGESAGGDSVSSASWQYGEDTDKMRNETTKWARRASATDPAFRLTVRQAAKQSGAFVDLSKSVLEVDSTLGIPDGMILNCKGTGAVLSTKFDQGKVDQNFYYCNDESTAIFSHPDNSKALLKSLKQSKRLMVELSSAKLGTKQLEFDLQDLQWDKIQSAPSGQGN
jgi:hypothetical protein